MLRNFGAAPKYRADSHVLPAAAVQDGSQVQTFKLLRWVTTWDVFGGLIAVCRGRALVESSPVFMVATNCRLGGT